MTITSASWKLIGGLKEEISSEVKIFRPTTLLHAASLARLQEDKLQKLHPATIPNKPTLFSSHKPPLFPTPPQIKTSPFPIPGPQPQGNPTFKKLSWTKMQAQRDKGSCNNCDEKFGPRHQCKTQQVFVLETMDKPEEKIEDAPEEVKEQLTVPKISLHALSSVATPQTMQVTGVI